MVRVLLRFNKDIIDRPITSEIILEKGTPINILAAHINQEKGEILSFPFPQSKRLNSVRPPWPMWRG